MSEHFAPKIDILRTFRPGWPLGGFYFCLFSWLILQILSQAGFMGGAAWRPLPPVAVGLALLFALRLTEKRPFFSAMLQGLSLVCLFFSLGLAAIPPQSMPLIWPVLGALLALYAALCRRMQFFAFMGYAWAFALPLGLDLFQGESRLLLGYYLAFCVPLPFLLRLRWHLLSVCALVFFVCMMFFYLGDEAYAEAYTQAQFFLLSFFILYLGILYQRLRQPDFNLDHTPDLVLSLGLSLALSLLQLSLTVRNSWHLILSLFVLGVFHAGVSLAARRLPAARGDALRGLYQVPSFIFFNLCLHFLLTGTAALAVYCLESILLFFWAGRVGRGRSKAVAILFLLFVAFYYFFAPCALLAGACGIGLTALGCAFLRHRERSAAGRRSGMIRPWTSGQEAFLLFFGLIWWFGGLAAFVLQNLPSPGLAFWVLSSSCAYFFYALARLFHFRSLRLVIFLPLFISIPAAFLPFIYQIRLEWPVISQMLSYNYLDGLGALAWPIAGLTFWTALSRAWRGLISRRLHALFLGLVSVELILVLTSSVRAWALQYDVLPSLLSVLAALPALGYIFILSCRMKSRVIFLSYRRIVFVLVPGLFFAALSLWFVLSLGSLGRDAPGGHYLPLLNPVELTQLACWAVFAYWQRRLRKISPPAPHLSSGCLFWVYGLFAFLWLHGVMFRVLQYFSQAEVLRVMDFVELRFIFACIWVIFGVILWLGAISHASGFSWFMGLGLLLAGGIMLIILSARLWGYVVAVPLTLTELAFLSLMLWRAPAPFSARGRKLGGR